jgi:hypothetical protein
MSDGAPVGPLLDPAWMPLLQPVSRLYVVTPFDREWDDLLEDALRSGLLGDVERGLVGGPLGTAKDCLSRPLASLLEEVGRRLRAGVAPTAEEIEPYRGLAIYGLWDRFGDQLQQLVDDNGVDVSFYDDFLRAYRALFEQPRLAGVVVPEPAHLLAIFYQARRACWFIATQIAGRSDAARRSRATIWRAIFGSDVRIYAGHLHRCVDEFPVLITGETGTGKDLAAKCLGWSRYIPFDPAARRFAAKYAEDFHVRSLVEVPADLLESTLFGHKKGSFTGAHEDRAGCLGLARANGMLFLDEIGEIPLPVQAKLLRPFQNREYVPLGETRPRSIHGRLVFATHRNLEAMIERGEFRADLYERMNGFRIHMPSLREMRPDGGLLDYIDLYVGAKIDDPALRGIHALRVMRTIQDERADYEWPRNQRELKNYTERLLHGGAPVEMPAERPLPTHAAAGDTPPESLGVPSSNILGWRAKTGQLDHVALLKTYVTYIFVYTGLNKSETARLTGFDRRALSKWIDPVLLARLLEKAGEPTAEKQRPPSVPPGPRPRKPGGHIRSPRRRPAPA